MRKSIDNVMKAIEAGIITRSTKAKLEELEAEEEQIELNILKEKTSFPKLTKEQILFALDKFRKLDLTIEANKERLIDNLVKCVLLYDDKLVITFNFKNEPVTVPTSEEFDAIEKSSDIEAFASPQNEALHFGVLFCSARTHFPTKFLFVPAKSLLFNIDRGIINSQTKDGDKPMNINIRHIAEQDKPQIIEMMRVFYASAAVFTNGSEEIFNADVDNCISDNPYIEGYVFEGDDGILGYAMLAKSFSTEFGKPCIWIEDIYVKEEYRGLGIGSLFFSFIEEKYPHSLFRLEVEAENERAVHVYKKCGYDVLPYMEMKKSVK